MDRRIALLPLLALAGTSLSGCVAAAIPALAGAGIIGTRVDGEGPDKSRPAASQPAPQMAAAAQPAPPPAPKPTVTVVPSATPAPSLVAATPTVPAPAPAAPSAPQAVRAPAPSAPPPAAPPVPPVATTPSPTATVVAAARAAVPPSTPPPAPAVPVAAPSAPRPEQLGFAQLVRYGRGVAAVSAQASGPLSAMLADPIALDGQRKRCPAGEQPVVVIDLDPAGGLFAPPADPERDVPRALGLAVLREAGVQIAWLSDLPVSEIGSVRNALEFAGLDVRGQDIVSLRRDAEDRKQARKESLAANSCIIAIAGDEKADFDERFRYLKNPEAGAALETAIGDGWFLIEPVFPAAK